MVTVLDPVYTNVGKRPIVPRGESEVTAYSFKFSRDSNPDDRGSICIQASRLEDFLGDLDTARQEEDGVLRYSALKRLEETYGLRK